MQQPNTHLGRCYHSLHETYCHAMMTKHELLHAVLLCKGTNILQQAWSLHDTRQHLVQAPTYSLLCDHREDESGDIARLIVVVCDALAILSAATKHQLSL